MRPDDGRVVSTFVVQALRNQPLTVNGDGSQTRSFCFRDDTVEGLIRLMDTPDDVTGPINLGNPVESTMLELAERIVELTGSRSRIEYRPLPQDDPRQRCPDIALARAVLGWEPRVALDDGLRRTVAFFEDQLLRAGLIEARVPALELANRCA